MEKLRHCGRDVFGLHQNSHFHRSCKENGQDWHRLSIIWVIISLEDLLEDQVTMVGALFGQQQ